MSFQQKLLATAVASLSIQSVLLAQHALAAEPENTSLSEEVIITATLGNHTTTTSPAFTTVVTADEIAKSSINSLADLLRESAGVNNYTDPSGRDELQIRGLSGQYTLILVNGKRASSSGALWRGSDFDYSSIPLNSIERVEIVRGPMSSLYGADAIGGVINIITKKPLKEEWKTTLNAEYRGIEAGAAGDQHRIGMNTSGRLTDDLSLSISGEEYEHDAWYLDTKSASLVPSLEHKKAKNLVSTLSWNAAENHKLDLDLGYNNDERPYALYSGVADFRAQEITRTDVAVTHEGKWDWGKVTSYIKQENSDIDDFNSRYNAPKQRALEEKNTYAKSYISTTLGSSALTAGIDYRQQGISDVATYLQTGEFNVKQLALFAQDEIKLAKGLNLTLGGRLDDHEVFGNHFSPKAYLVYQATDSLTLKGGVSQAFKAPDGSKLSAEYSIISCGGACYLAGNPNLKPESSTSYEAGFELKQDDWNLSLSLFNNDIEDLIEREIGYNTANKPISAKWINIAEATTKGVEIQGAYRFSESLSLKANYTYLDTEYTNIDGNTTVLAYRPTDKASLAFNWQATSKLSADLGVHYFAGMQYAAWVQVNGSWVQGFPTLPSYYRTDLAFAYAATDAFKLRFGVKNLENVRLDEEDKNFTTHELGRNFYVSAAYSF
jgi:outer membrane receptor for ferrienterochelin and colicins